MRPRRAVEAFDDAARDEASARPEISVRHTVRVGSDRASGRSQGEPDHDCDATSAPDVLAVHAQAQPDKVAVIVDASGGARRPTTTFAELNAMVNRLANGLYDGGARAGERLVWCGPNSLEVLATIHAARKLGLVAVPLSYRFNAEEMAYVIDNSDATTVVVDAEQAPLVAEVRGEIPKVRTVVVFGGAVPDGCTAWDDLLAGQSDTGAGRASGRRPRPARR